jgi:hypothetical protein
MRHPLLYPKLQQTLRNPVRREIPLLFLFELIASAGRLENYYLRAATIHHREFQIQNGTQKKLY